MYHALCQTALRAKLHVKGSAFQGRDGSCRHDQTQLRSAVFILGVITFLRCIKTREAIHVIFRKLFFSC